MLPYLVPGVMKIIKSLIVLIVGLLSAIYLVNPTAGLVEFIPDNFPFFGNIDEATATTLLLASLKYFGIDLTSIFRRNKALKK